MAKGKYKAITADTIIFLIGNVLTKMVQFFLLPLFTTYMSTQAYGDGELLNNFTEFLLPFVTLCIYDAVFRFTVDDHASHALDNAIVVIAKSFVACGSVTIIVTVLFDYGYALLVYFMTFAYGLKMVFSYHVRGRGKSLVFSLGGVINALSMVVFSWLFLVKYEYQEKGYLLSILFSYLITSGYLFFAGRIYKDLSKFVVDKAESADMLKYSTPLIFYNTGYWLTNMAGRFLIAFYLGDAEAGIYMAAAKIATLINMVQQAFFMAFQLNASRELKNEKHNNYYYDILKLFTVLVVLSGGLLVLLTDLLSSILLKKEFAVAKDFLPLIILAATVDCYFCYYKAMYTVYKRTIKLIPSVAVGAVVNILLGVVLIPNIGIIGACVASFACFMAQGIYRLIDTKKFADLKVDVGSTILYLLVIVAIAALIMKQKESLAIALYILLVMVIIISKRKMLQSVIKLGR